MDLTYDEIESLDQGHAVPVIVNGRPCIVLRRDIYDRVKRAIDLDEREPSPEDAYPAILAAWDQEEDPGLDVYQDYKRR